MSTSSFGIGQRCQVVYERGTDYFRRKDNASSEYAGGAFLGKIVALPSKKKVHVAFDDGSEETVDSQDVQILTPGITHSHIWYSTADVSNHCVETQAAHTKPPQLHAGDLVLGQFQAAAHQWFRGRIARSYPQTRTCDILYDDGDAERGVPWAFCILLQKGADHPAWLTNLIVPLASKKGIASGQVAGAAPRKPVYVEYTDEQGNKTTEKKPYRNVVIALMQAHAPDEWLSWPKHAPSRPVLQQTHGSGGGDKKKNQTKKTLAVGATNKKKKVAEKPVRKRGRAARGSKEDEHDNDDDYDDDESVPSPPKRRSLRKFTNNDDDDGDDNYVDNGNANEKSTTRARRVSSRHKPKGQPNKQQDTPPVPTKKSKAKQRQQQPQIRRRLSLDTNATAVPVVPDTHPVSIPLSPEQINYKEMDDAMAEALLDALQSRDVEFGQHFLTYLQTQSKTTLANLHELVICGPQAGDDRIYPDPRRLEMVLSGILPGSCAKHMDWQKAMGQLLGPAPYYTRVGDERRTSAMALQRMGLTMHARACCAQLVLQELPYAAAAATTTTTTTTCGLDAKETLQQLVQVYTSTAIYGEHLRTLIVGAPDFVTCQTNRLLECLGRLVSLWAERYCQESGEDMDGVAYIMVPIIQKRLVQDELDEVSVMKIHLNLILRLNSPSDLYPKLADQLGVAPEYNVIFSAG